MEPDKKNKAEPCKNVSAVKGECFNNGKDKILNQQKTLPQENNGPTHRVAGLCKEYVNIFLGLCQPSNVVRSECTLISANITRSRDYS